MNDLRTFQSIYEEQIKFQNEMTNKYPYDFEVKELPEDNVQGCSYHIQHLISEIGEILGADKRWKNYRNGKYDKDEKTNEIADCFIVLMNVAIFSGLSSKELEDTICKKIDQNFERLK